MRDRSLARLRIARDRDSEILPRPRSTFTRFILRFLKLESSDTGFGVVVVFMVGNTSRSVMCFVCNGGSWSSTIPPQFLTQFSPVMKLLPLPPHPLNLNLLQTWRAASKWYRSLNELQEPAAGGKPQGEIEGRDMLVKAISAGELVTELLLLMFLANVGKLTLEAASVVSLRIRLVATGAGGLVARSKEGGVVLIGSSFVILRFSARSAGPPQLITHSCIVAKLFSFP